jgi:hypothetical protein
MTDFEQPEFSQPDQEGITADQFDDWLDGATLAQGSVEILQNPALLSRWDDLQRRYERAQQIARGEGGITDDNPIAALEAEAEQLLADIEASRTSWHVRALTSDDLAAILAAHPLQDEPRFRGKIPSVQPNPTETQAKAFLGMYNAYRAQLERWQDEHAEEIEAFQQHVLDVNLACGAEKVARATVRIEQDGRTVAEHVSVEQVIRLAARIGDPQVNRIITEIDELSETAPEVPPSFLSRTSGSDQG